MKARIQCFAAVMLLAASVVARAEKEEREQKPAAEPEKKPAAARVLAPAVIAVDTGAARPRLEATPDGLVVRGEGEQGDIELRSTKEGKVQFTITRSYTVEDPEFKEKYPTLQKHLHNLPKPMVPEDVYIKVEAKMVYDAADVAELRKRHADVLHAYEAYVTMFERFQGRIGAAGGAFAPAPIRIEVGPAVPAPRKAEYKDPAAPKPER